MCSQVRLRAALIEELTKMFTICYEKPPTANQLDVLNQMQSSNVPSSFLEENIAFNYQKRLNDLIAGLLIPSGPISIHIPGHHQTKCDSSLLVLDLARNGQGIMASWNCGLWVRSLSGNPTAVIHIVGRERWDYREFRRNRRTP